MGRVRGYKSSSLCPHPMERRSGRRAQAELSYLFLQTACQDTDEDDDDEDQVRARGEGPGSLYGSLHRAGWAVHLGLAGWSRAAQDW